MMPCSRCAAMALCRSELGPVAAGMSRKNLNCPVIRVLFGEINRKAGPLVPALPPMLLSSLSRRSSRRRATSALRQRLLQQDGAAHKAKRHLRAGAVSPGLLLLHLLHMLHMPHR